MQWVILLWSCLKDSKTHTVMQGPYYLEQVFGIICTIIIIGNPKAKSYW